MDRMKETDYEVMVAGGGLVSYGLESEDVGSAAISEVEKLANEFEAHESEEAKFVRSYKEILERTRDPLIKFLLRLIVSDEEKHQALTHAMVSTLKGSLAWTHIEDAIEDVCSTGEDKDEILKVTENFLRLEREGIKDYKKLMEETKGYYHGLFNLLLKSMVHDSEKHVEILEFLKKRLKEK